MNIMKFYSQNEIEIVIKDFTSQVPVIQFSSGTSSLTGCTIPGG